MARLALLIGVSDYASDLPPLLAVRGDIARMAETLGNPNIGGFEVKVLSNPDREAMGADIEELFNNGKREDLILLYFSGHGVKDESGRLYLASSSTRSQNGRLIKATAVEASFIQDQMKASRARRQVIILDCCFSGAFAEGLSAKSVVENISEAIEAQLVTKELRSISGFDSTSQKDTRQLLNLLGPEGRAILTSSTASQPSFEERGSEISVYTRYLIEGLVTGAADTDSNSVITIDELHEYASGKVFEASPAMQPKIYPVGEGYKIKIAKALSDPKTTYRKEAERLVHNGKFSIPAQRRLAILRLELGLSSEDSSQIEMDVCQPFQDYRSKLEEFENTLKLTLEEEFPLSENTLKNLEDYQLALKLRDEDAITIKERLLKASSIEEPQNLEQQNTPIVSEANLQQSEIWRFPEQLLAEVALIGAMGGLVLIIGGSLTGANIWIGIIFCLIVTALLIQLRIKHYLNSNKILFILLTLLVVVLIIPSLHVWTPFHDLPIHLPFSILTTIVLSSAIAVASVTLGLLIYILLLQMT